MRERGFTLIEILVALAMLSFGLLAVAPMFVSAARQTKASADAGLVGALAMERMETLRATPYDSLVVGGSLTTDTSVSGTDFFDRTTPGFVVRWQVSTGATADGGLRLAVRAETLAVQVGRSSSLTLDSIRAGG